MLENSFRQEVLWRPIHIYLYKIDRGKIVERLLELRETCYGKSPAEIYMLFNPTTIGEAADLQFSARARLIEGIRNALVFTPLMLMLVSLGIAAQAYTQNAQILGGATFFNAWINGFSPISSVAIFKLPIPLAINAWRWFTFTDVLIADFFLLVPIFLLTIATQTIEGGASHQARELMIWINQEFSQLCNASYVRSIGTGPGSEQPEWAVRVHEAIDHLHRVLQGVEGTVDLSQKKFAQTIERFVDVYDQQNQSVDKLLEATKEVENTINGLGGIYIKLYEASAHVANVLPGIAGQLKKVASSQDEMTKTLKDMTADIHQLAQPFQAVGLAEMARQMQKQQKENISLLREMESRLSHAASKTGSFSEWLGKLLLKKSK